MNNKSVILNTIGYMCIGLTVWMLSLSDAGWISGSSARGMAMAFGLGAVVLGVIAILAFFHGRALDAVIFFGVAGAFWTMHQGGGMDAGAAEGWFWLLWAVFFFYVWLASFKAGWARMLFLLAAWVSLLADALLAWSGAAAFHYIGGYVGLLTGLVATYISAAEIVNHGCGKTVLDTGLKEGS